MARTHGIRFYGTSSSSKKASGKIMAPLAAWKLYNQGNQALADCVTAMDEEERQAYDQLSELPGPQEDDGWEDIKDVAMDIDQILDGTNPVELSHEGGEFYELDRKSVV